MRVRMRVHAGLHTLLFAAARCSARTPDLQALSIRFSALPLVWPDF